MDFAKLKRERAFKKSEWRSRDRYQAWGRAMMAGRVRVLAPGLPEPTLSLDQEGFDPYAAVRQWHQDPDLRREFRGNQDRFLAYAKGVAEGRVKEYGRTGGV